MLRGYAKLKKSGELGRIMEVQIALVEASLLIHPNRISEKLFGAAVGKANEAVRDFLITRLALLALNKSLLVSLGKKNGKVVHPLPAKWRSILKSLGWNVSDVKCSLLWAGYLFLCWGYGGFVLIKKSLQGVASIFKSVEPIQGKFVYFAGLTKNELPQGKEGDSYDVISWYLQWAGRNKEIKTIGHNVKSVAPLTHQGVKVLFMDPLLPPRGAVGFLHFLLWGGWASCQCFFDLLRGRWWSPLMFGPCVQYYIARHQGTYAVDYLFNNSGPRKPLWLYEVESKGATTTFYFYSTNCDSFMTEEGYQPTPAYYRNMQWSRYLVWDEEQGEFLVRSGNKKGKNTIVGPIWFSESAEASPEFLNQAVAVFDIQPRRKSIYITLGVPAEYYIPSIAVKFMEDAQEAAGRSGLTFLWKEKRNLLGQGKSFLATPYAMAVNRMISAKQVVPTYPGIAAYRIIERCRLVISMPFTSTALIARHLGKPSCYYDPSGLIQKQDRAAHGIPIITGMEELKSWFDQPEKNMKREIISKKPEHNKKPERSLIDKI